MPFVIYSPLGKQLAITDSDRDWLARAVEAEGEPRALVAQTLVNRWANAADWHPHRWPTLTELVRDYSQPVNPGWFPGGPLLMEHVAELEKLGKHAEAAAELRRAEMRPAHAARNSFTPATNDAVRRAIVGPIEIPHGAVHFGPQKGGSWAPLTLVPGGPGRNAIYASDSRTRRAGTYRLAPVQFNAAIWGPAAALDTGSPVVGLVVMAMGLGAVWRLSRARKGRR